MGGARHSSAFSFDVVTRDWSGGHSVRLEPLHELVGMRQRGQVSALHLVGREAEPLTHDAPLEVRREEAVVAAQQEAGRDVRPRVQWPRLFEWRARLLT